jgi:hypothetical protein
MKQEIEVFLCPEKFPEIKPEWTAQGDHLKSVDVCFYCPELKEWMVGKYGEIGGTKKPMGKRPMVWFGVPMLDKKQVNQWFYLPKPRGKK